MASGAARAGPAGGAAAGAVRVAVGAVQSKRPGYERPRTYTDGLWRAEQPPPADVVDALGRVPDPAAVHHAVLASLAQRVQPADAAPPLSWGQRVVLEALRGLDDQLLVAATPHVHDLLLRIQHDAAASGDVESSGRVR